MYKKRKSLDLTTKFEIIKASEDVNVSKREIAKRYGLSSSTLFTILKNKEKITTAVLRDNMCGKSKKLRSAEHCDLEAVLYEWFCEQQAANIRISGPMIRSKAEELAFCMNVENFKCSGGWLYRFKTRKGITHHKISGESAFVNEKSVNDWTAIRGEILERYDARDIYNAVESALYYNLLPDKTLEIKNDPCSGGKRSKERLTILLCSNMDGTDKLNPYVIGKLTHPKCFQDAKHIHCTYESNEKAWMTPKFFIQWLKNFDAKVGDENRTVALFIHHCPAHPVTELRNIELVFLPPNCAKVLQPLEQGVFRLLKHKFRTMLVNAVVRHLSVRDMQNLKWNLLDAIRAIAVSWKEIPPQYITACFRYAGFHYNSLEKEDKDRKEEEMPEPEGWSMIVDKLKVSCTYTDYLSIDKNVMVCDEMMSTDHNEIMGSESMSSGGEEEESSTVPSQAALMQALDTINSIYRATNASVEDLEAYQEVERYVMKTFLKVQTNDSR